MNQVAKDSHLLDTAQDLFHFVIKFFEPINVSATHIYHSALELCPTSSIIRKLYYDKCHGLTRLPRVMIGNPDSWDPTISCSGREDYSFCTWSPCGRFIAAQTEAIVEIRNQLTFQLLAVLRSPKYTSLEGPVAYSPDGRSLACGSDGIVVWDIQTGGVAQSIDFKGTISSLVWSLDGRTLGSAVPYLNDSSHVRTYDVASGAQLFGEKLEKEWGLHLWACEKSFRFISVSVPSDPSKFSISEIGPTRIKIEELPAVGSPPFTFEFSPSTYRISISTADTLQLWDARNKQSLLQEPHKESLSFFSPDASLFAAPHKYGFRVWKYTSGGYLLSGEYLLSHIPSFSPDELELEFSPNSTSILSWCMNVLQVWRLHAPPTTPQTRRQLSAISRSGHYVATARQSQTAVMIINQHSQTPQFIDAGGEIEGLAITGNVLLVAFSKNVVGWLLTEEGAVDGVVDNRRAGPNDSIWTATSPLQDPKSLCFRVAGQVGVIGTDSTTHFVYHTETGGFPDRLHRAQNFGFPWVSFYQPSDYQEYYYLCHRDSTPQRDIPPEDGWLVSRTTTENTGWVVDPEGKHRLWLPVEWRAPWDPKNCHHDMTTLFTRIGGQPVIIKF